jgi:quercetin dioxygenase-like cupin family protein
MAVISCADLLIHRKDYAMLQRYLVLSVALIVSHALPSRAIALDNSYPAVPLLSTGINTIGETIHYPTIGPARVTAAIVTLAPGATTIIHKHGVPLFAYVLDGELTVDYGELGQRTYRQGQGFMEAMAVAHFGINQGSQPVRLLAVYMGAEGARNVLIDK